MGIRSRDNTVKQSIFFIDGNVHVEWGIHRKVDTALVFRTPQDVIRMLKVTPDVMIMLMSATNALDQGDDIANEIRGNGFRTSLETRDAPG